MQIKAIDLLMKLSELSSALAIYQKIVDKLDDGENIPEDYLKSTTSIPDSDEMRKAIADITALRQKLYDRIIREVNENNNTNLNWLRDKIEISVDEALWEAVSAMTKKNNDYLGKALSWVKYSFFAWFEFIKNENTFVQNCLNLDIDAAQEACVGYLNFKYPDASAEKIAELTKALVGIKDFRKIRNQFNLNLEITAQYSMNLSLALESTCAALKSDSFFKFVTRNLTQLANDYQVITKHLIDIFDDVPKHYNPGEKTTPLLIKIRDVLSLPFQKITRYGLTFKEIKENALKVTNNSLCDDALNIAVLISEACTSVEETVRKADQAIGEPPKAIPKKRQSQPIQEITNPTVNTPKTITSEEKLSYIKQSMLNNTWKKTGRGAVYIDPSNSETYRLPRHMSLILNLIDQTNDNKDKQLQNVVEAAQIAVDFRPSCLNFFYQRDVKTQQLYELIASFSPDKTDDKPTPAPSS